MTPGKRKAIGLVKAFSQVPKPLHNMTFVSIHNIQRKWHGRRGIVVTAS